MLVTKALFRVTSRNSIKRYAQAPAYVVQFSLSSVRRYNAVAAFTAQDTFARRHIGPSDKDIEGMLRVCGANNLHELSEKVVFHFSRCFFGRCFQRGV